MLTYRILTLIALSLILMGSRSVESTCCYFAAKDKDVLQPAQKAFISWNPVEGFESFTVQPKFEGDAADFGMVVPTPSQPKLDEMLREFFKELAVFTILERMDLRKYKLLMRATATSGQILEFSSKSSVKVLETGIGGLLDYKTIVADRSRGPVHMAQG